MTYKTLALYLCPFALALGGCASTSNAPDAIYFGTAQQTPRLTVQELNQPVLAAYSTNIANGAGVLKHWPVASKQRTVISPFGPRGRGLHRGMDIKAPANSPVQAVRGGVVTFSGTERGYGYVVKIDHGDGFSSTYAHLAQNDVDAGDSVSEGDAIGTVGATGNATTPHVHFELHHQGKPVDPSRFLPQ